MKKKLVIPESDLVFSHQTFLDNPFGTKAFIFSCCSFIISILFVLLSEGINSGVLCHINILTFNEGGFSNNETIIRAPSIALISTKALLLSMPFMITTLVSFSIYNIMIALKSEYGTVLIGFAYILIFFSILLLYLQFPQNIDYYWLHF